MKVRTAEEIYDLTTYDLSWRKKEIFLLQSYADIDKSSTNKINAILRSIVVITYAHWEGFIKLSSRAYIEYISVQRLRNDELTPNFLALSIMPILLNSSPNGISFNKYVEITSFFLNDLSKQNSMTSKNVIQTKSNLSAKIFKEIVSILGFDYSIYESKEKFIDERLLKTRNKIAHGDYIPLKKDDVKKIEDECVYIMNHFKNQIDNAVYLKTYKR